MQNSQWLYLIFVLSNLLLSQGYEALHEIPFLKAQIATSLNAQLIFPTKMLSEHFQSCSWDFLQPSFVLSPLPFLLMTPSWENIFQNKGATCSFGAVLPLGLWLSLPVLGFHTGTGPCTDTPPAPLPAACTVTCGIYLFSIANAGSNAHLLINLNQSHRKALVLHNDKLHRKHVTLITGLQRLQHGELRLPTTVLLHFITRFCGKHLQICCWIQKFRKSGSRLEILRYPISPPISQELHSVYNHFSESGMDWETKWKELLVCVPLICTLQRPNWH